MTTTVPNRITEAAGLAGLSVVTPDDADWDSARRPWNVSIDLRPAAVVTPRTPKEVTQAVSLARLLGLRVAPMSTGHNAAPHGDLGDTVLIRMHQMRGVRVDPITRTAHVEGGAVWADVTAAAAPHGLAALAGSAVDVGVAGYVLGGGVSWLARSHGLAANSVLGLDVVTSDGVLRHVDAQTEPDLFWALRGGGGNFGVVVGIDLQLFEVGTVVAGNLFFPIERLHEVMTAFADWTAGVPESVTSCVRALRLPPLPDIPEPLRGKAFAVVNGAIQEPAERAAEILAPLRALGPVMDTWALMPASRLVEIHMDPDHPVPARGDGLVISELGPDVVDAVVAQVGPDSGSALLQVELRHLGGAASRPHPRGGAVDHLPEGYLVYAVGITPDPEAVAVVEQQVASVVGALEPWRASRDYLNLVDSTSDPRRFHDPATLARLQAVRSTYDPSATMRGNHTVGS
jgi:hypothetical protein